MIQVIAGTSDRRHKSLPLPLSQEYDAWCRPRFSAVVSVPSIFSACAGEFILIGLAVDTIHRGTTMFDRRPTQRP